MHFRVGALVLSLALTQVAFSSAMASTLNSGSSSGEASNLFGKKKKEIKGRRGDIDLVEACKMCGDGEICRVDTSPKGEVTVTCWPQGQGLKNVPQKK